MNFPQDFRLTASGGEEISTTTFQGHWTVLYFYPKDTTPGCASEAQDFRDHYDAFRALGAEILGVSRDSIAAHDKFRTKETLPFLLVSDPDGVLCRAFDVIKEKKNYGKTYMGIERSTFLVSTQGAVMREWRKVKVAGHVAAVLQALQIITDRS